MHEMTVAESLLTIILEEAAKHNAKPIGVKISCGTLNSINDEALNFAFEVITKDTSCEGLSLKIEHKPLKGLCKNCTQKFDIEFSSPKCTKCGSEDFQMMTDAPLILEEIEFQTD
ncbi:MAG: hydrogenase maturation nickel metallochaperone HypA [Planctomycetes bacterium]|nr:hydrogenase maturation nickel metallochaperone HypA [Planctomycetota bacterium]